MATMQDIIKRAYRKLGIVAFDSAMTADQADEGLETLNSMLHEWALRGVNVGHTDAALTTVYPYGDAFMEGTVHILASRLSPNYEVPASFDADDFFRAIQVAYLDIAEVSFERALTEVPTKKARDGTLSYQGR